MKVLAAALAVLLLGVICSLAEADLGDSSNPEAKHTLLPQKSVPSQLRYHDHACCFSHISRPIPRRLITSVHMTSTKCSQPAVILVTKKGRMVCANPEAPWVQKYLKDLETPEN
ncbi:CCL5 protein, partial [Neodrepanis coruscans]|nr:CCL5 protein [Neodrepanis coruscans]